jgi:hypothetical protein
VAVERMRFVDLAGIRRATGWWASRPAAQRNLRFRNGAPRRRDSQVFHGCMLKFSPDTWVHSVERMTCNVNRISAENGIW